MVECKTLDEFIRLNHMDIVKFVKKKFTYLTIKRFDRDFDDIIQNMYLHFARNKVVEKFDPAYKVKFSTYIYRCVSNNLIAFNHKLNRNEQIIYSDSVSSFDDLSIMLEKKIFKKEYSQDFDADSALALLRKKDIDMCKSKLKLSDLFNFYERGFIDIEIAERAGLTRAGLGARKKILRKVLLENKSLLNLKVGI